ncbi:hypothetical protein [Dyella koreensis]|uniref:Uncharacterized protein n=1 Tax=Dyella koreensis TaxID=311235 RepID=A0ABW8K614_9GAMM
MFGWLTHALATVCPHFHTPAGQPRWLRIAPEALVSRLPLLGSVLYLPMHAGDASAEHSARGWLADRVELIPLLHTHWLLAACVIGSDGPREWIECVDANGCLRARLHLLPDTDYLAWDVLLSAGEPIVAPPFGRVQRPFRAACARLFGFRHKQMSGLHVLSCTETVHLSALGQGIAREVAKAEALELSRSD